MKNDTRNKIQERLTKIQKEIGGRVELEHKQVVYAENGDGDQLLVKTLARGLEIVVWAGCRAAEKRKRCASIVRNKNVCERAIGCGRLFTIPVDDISSLQSALTSALLELSQCEILSEKDKVLG